MALDQYYHIYREIKNLGRPAKAFISKIDGLITKTAQSSPPFEALQFMFHVKEAATCRPEYGIPYFYSRKGKVGELKTVLFLNCFSLFRCKTLLSFVLSNWYFYTYSHASWPRPCYLFDSNGSRKNEEF